MGKKSIIEGRKEISNGSCVCSRECSIPEEVNIDTFGCVEDGTSMVFKDGGGGRQSIRLMLALGKCKRGSVTIGKDERK